MADAQVEQMAQCETQVSRVCLTDKLEKKCFGGWKLNVFYKLVSSLHVGTEAHMAKKPSSSSSFPVSGRETLLLKVWPRAVCVCY